MWTKENIPDLTGKIAIVTGANVGVGYETALALYEKGAQVTLACRDLEKANEAAAQMRLQQGKGNVHTAVLDLASLTSVRRFANEYLQQHTQLHLLINNAGVMIPPASKTEEGFELQFGVNFIGHFALTGLLYPMMNATDGARIITVSSNAYLNGTIDFDNLRSEHSYDPMREYRQSKLADIMLSLELQRRIVAKSDKVVSIAAQPGANNTALSRHMDAKEFETAVERVGGLMEPWQGALPSLYAAVSADAIGGALYGPDQDGGYRGYPARAEILTHALNEDVAKRLWVLAEEATGVVFP